MPAGNETSGGSTFEKFSSTTVIRVFNFIRTSEFLVERLFWIAVLLGFSIGTVWNVTQTIRTFLDEPTATRLTFPVNSSNNGGAMSFPDAGLCFEMRSDVLMKMYGAQIDDVIDYIDRKADFALRLKEKLIKIYEIEDERNFALANLTAKAVVDTSGLLNAHHKFDRSSADLHFSADEIALLSLTTAMYYRLRQLEMPQPIVGRFSTPPTKAVQRLHRVYAKRQTNFSELFTLTATTMCVVLQIRASILHYGLSIGTNRFSGHNVCKYASVVYFGVDRLGDEVICYRSGRENFALIFHGGFDEVILSVHVESLYKESSAAPRKIVVDLSGKYAIWQQPPLFLAFNEKQSVNFSLETVSMSLNLRRSGCWKKRDRMVQFQCPIWCAAEARFSLCNCLVSFAEIVPKFARWPDAVRSCALNVDENLELFEEERYCRASFSSFNNCSLRCYDSDCESFLFSSTVQVDDPSLAYLNASTVVRLRLTKFVYEKVDEYITMDATALITSLGGNLSLYMGASFLALIHILVFFLKLPFEAACKSRVPNVQEGIVLTSSATYGMSIGRLEEAVKLLVDDVASLKQNVTQCQQDVTAIRLCVSMSSTRHVAVSAHRFRSQSVMSKSLVSRSCEV